MAAAASVDAVSAAEAALMTAPMAQVEADGPAAGGQLATAPAPLQAAPVPDAAAAASSAGPPSYPFANLSNRKNAS